MKRYATVKKNKRRKKERRRKVGTVNGQESPQGRVESITVLLRCVVYFIKCYKNKYILSFKPKTK